MTENILKFIIIYTFLKNYYAMTWDKNYLVKEGAQNFVQKINLTFLEHLKTLQWNTTNPI